MDLWSQEDALLLRDWVAERKSSMLLLSPQLNLGALDLFAYDATDDA